MSLNHNDHLFPKQQGLLHLPGLHCQHQGHPGGQREAPRRCGRLHRKYKGYNVFELATYKNAHKIKIFKFKMAKLADGLKKAGSALALATSKAHCGQLHH